MPWWMRYAKQEETSDGTALGDSTGGAGDGGAGSDLSTGTGEATGGTAQPVEDGMLAAIRSHLNPGGAPADATDGGGEGRSEPGSDGSRDVRVRDPATGRFVEKPAVQAQAAPPKVDPKQAAIDPAKPAVVDPTKPAAPKKADDFGLKPEEKQTLTQNAQRRVHEIHKEWKAAESQWTAERETLAVQNQQLQQARDSIMGVMEETQTTPEDLTQLLSFNQLMKTNPRGAIEMLEGVRAQLYAAVGQEAPGVDLLKDHPDLAQRVANNEIHREDAVALANARRRDQALQQHSQQQNQQQQQAQSIKQQQDSAMTAIDQWAQQTAQKDIDWAGKESKITDKLDVIVKRYPPNLWLQRLQEEYESTPAAPQQQQNVQQRSAEVPGTGSNIPLRASGTRGGAPQPASMEEAVMRGLGIRAG